MKTIKKQLLMVDCDGTIRQPRSNSKFINHPDDQESIPNSLITLDKYKKDGFEIVGITNQAGVYYNQKSLSNCVDEQFNTLRMFRQLSCIYFCPDLGETCFKAFPLDVNHFATNKYLMSELVDNQQILPGFNFRKPSPGMLLWAMQDRGFRTVDECLYVGDRPEDEEAAKKINMDFIEAEDFLL